MNFKTFYIEQEKKIAEEAKFSAFENKMNKEQLNEFGGTGVDTLAKVAGATTKFVGGLAGKAVGGAIKAITGHNVDAIKAGWSNAINLAEKIYPFDKANYAALRKTQDKGNLITQFLTIQHSQTGTAPFTGYSVGMDIALRARDYTSKEVQDLFSKMHTVKKGKGNTSYLSLIEACNNTKIGEVRFKKMNNAKDVDALFDSMKIVVMPAAGKEEVQIKEPPTILGKLIFTASYFSMWKNKYDGHDEENMSKSIVSDLLSSGMLRSFSVTTIQRAIKELESSKPPIEVSAESIAEQLSMSIKEQTDAIVSNLNSEVTKIDGLSITDLYKDEEEKKSLDNDIQDFINGLKQNMPKAITNDGIALTKLFILSKYLGKSLYQMSTLKITQIFKGQKYLCDIFKAPPLSKTINDSNEKDMLEKFLALTHNNLLDEKGVPIKLSKEILSDVKKFWGVIGYDAPTKIKGETTGTAPVVTPAPTVTPPAAPPAAVKP